MTSRVALVVVNYRSVHLTDAFLAAAGGGADELVVVDCTPDDPGLRAVADRHDARLVDPGANLGYGTAANLGADGVTADVLIVANPDVVVDGPTLRRLAAAAQGEGLVAPTLRNPDGTLQRSAHHRDPRFLATAFDLSLPFQALAARVAPDWHATLMSTRDHAEPQDCHHVLGALIAVDLVAFRSVGGFDPGFFMYREETDLCRRLRAAGWSVRYDPSLCAEHASGGSSSHERPLATRPEHLTSHYRFIERHWGRGRRLAAQALGTLAAASSVATGPDRAAWRAAMAWHLGRR